MNDRVEDPMQTKYNDPQATIIEVDELSAMVVLHKLYSTFFKQQYKNSQPFDSKMNILW